MENSFIVFTIFILVLFTIPFFLYETKEEIIKTRIQIIDLKRERIMGRFDGYDFFIKFIDLNTGMSYELDKFINSAKSYKHWTKDINDDQEFIQEYKNKKADASIVFSISRLKGTKYKTSNLYDLLIDKNYKENIYE